MKSFLLYLLSFVVAFAYGKVYASNYLVNNWEKLSEKPFVYRQFSYQAIKLLDSFMPFNKSSVIFIAVFGVLFVAAFVYLLKATSEDFKHKELAAFIALCLFCLCFIARIKPYDLPTAFFFTLAVACLAHGSAINYLVVFSIACFNRETTILLLPISLIYCWKAASGLWQLIFMQVFSYCTAQALIRTAYKNMPGIDFLFSPISNINAHVNEPIRAYIVYVVVFFVFLLVKINWKNQHSILKTAFVVLASSLTVFYFAFGQPFEFRVFAELFPIIAAMLLPRLYKTT